MNEQEEFEFRHRFEMEQAKAAPPIQVPENVAGSVLRGARDLGASVLGGAGAIGSTLLEVARTGKKEYGAQPASTLLDRRAERFAGVEGGLREMGADTDSWVYKGGKLLTELLGTAGVGSTLSLGAKAAGAAPTFVNALRTSGMTTGAPQGALAALLTRGGAGAATGGAAAGLVNPEDAGLGALIGGALPPALQGAGALGQLVGRTVRGPEVPQALQKAVQGAREAGYVIPPTQAKPTLANRVIEGFSGKITTAQNASAKNQAVTNQLASKALGLAPETQITPDVLKAVRAEAGQAYEAVRGAGTVIPDEAYAKAINRIGDEMQGAARSFPGLKKNEIADLVETLSQPQFDAGDAIDAIRVLRDKADGLFTNGEKGSARAYRAASEALEGALERHLAGGSARARLPASPILNTPRTPTPQQMKELGRVENVPLSSAYSTQAQRGGKSGGDLVAGYGDIPVAVRREDGSYLLLDGHHRADASLASGKQSMQMHVIDAKSYDPEIAGLKKTANKAADSAALDDLMAELESAGFKPSAAPPAVDGNLLQAFRAARQRIAKTYSVEKALNTTTGSVDARKLAAQLNRGKPLSGELKQAGDFANQFPKAAQTVEGMGSLPQTSPLDWSLGAIMSGATMNPLMMLTAGARPLARAAALSPMVQNRLGRVEPGALARLMANPNAQQALYRGAPMIAADR